MNSESKKSKLPIIFLRLGIAWAVGACVYFIAVALTVLDGMISFVIQPFCAAFVSAVSVIACVLVGFLLRLPGLRSFWRRSSLPAVILCAISLVLLIYSCTPGQMGIVTDESTGEKFRSLGSTSIYGYFLLIFAVANWPWKALNPDMADAQRSKMR